jgi:hypothetical protein
MKGTSMKIRSGGVANLINIIGKNCKISQVLREGIVNGIEANARATSGRGTVVMKRDWEYPEKFSIVNYDGEFLSEDIAVNNLATLGSSGNEGHKSNSDNFGIGAKVSYLPKASEGILYRSISSDNESNKFQIMKVNGGEYGVRQWVDSDGDVSNYVGTECKNIPEGKFGTEMVLMGDSIDEKTWTTMCDKVSSIKVPYGTGESLVTFVQERFWEDLGSDIFVQKYDSSYNETEIKQVIPLKDEITSDDFTLKGVIELSGEGVPKGTKAYYACTKTKVRNKSYGLRGVKDARDTYGKYFISFAWRKENYRDYKYDDFDKIKPENTNYHIKRAKACGFYVEQKAFVVVFELPDSYDAGVSQDRMRLTNVNEMDFFEAFRNNMPEEIVEYLSKNTENVGEDLESEIKKAFSHMTNPPKTVGGVRGGHPGGGNPGKRTGTGGNRPKKKEGTNKLKSFEIPDMILSTDSEAELISFNIKDYKLIYNAMHPVCQFRASAIKNKIPNAPKDIIESEIKRLVIIGSISRIFEIQNVYKNKSVQDKEDLWSGEKLEGIWNLSSEGEAVKRVKKVMSKQGYSLE